MVSTEDDIADEVAVAEMHKLEATRPLPDAVHRFGAFLRVNNFELANPENRILADAAEPFCEYTHDLEISSIALRAIVRGSKKELSKWCLMFSTTYSSFPLAMLHFAQNAVDIEEIERVIYLATFSLQTQMVTQNYPLVALQFAEACIAGITILMQRMASWNSKNWKDLLLSLDAVRSVAGGMKLLRTNNVGPQLEKLWERLLKEDEYDETSRQTVRSNRGTTERLVELLTGTDDARDYQPLIATV